MNSGHNAGSAIYAESQSEKNIIWRSFTVTWITWLAIWWMETDYIIGNFLMSSFSSLLKINRIVHICTFIRQCDKNKEL